jgi:hypothetical protein
MPDCCGYCLNYDRGDHPRRCYVYICRAYACRNGRCPSYEDRPTPVRVTDNGPYERDQFRAALKGGGLPYLPLPEPEGTWR